MAGGAPARWVQWEWGEISDADRVTRPGATSASTSTESMTTPTENRALLVAGETVRAQVSGSTVISLETEREDG